MLTRAIVCSTRYFSFATWRDQHVVLVVAGDRHDHVGAHDAGALEHPQLGRVAVLDVVLELLLDDQVAVAVGLDQGHLVTLADQLAREVPPDLAGAGDDDVHQEAASSATALRVADHGLAQHVDRDLRRAHGVQALLLVPVRAVGVEHAHDHLRHLEALLRELGDDDVRVVAVGGADDHVGAVDARLVERIHLERGADREPPAGVLPALVQVVVEERVGLLVLVEHADLVPLAQVRFAIAEPTRPQPTISTNTMTCQVAGTGDVIGFPLLIRNELPRSLNLTPRPARPPPPPAPSGGAVTSTRQGAFSST